MKKNIAPKKNQIIGYIRVSTDKQDAENQKHRILEYAQLHQFMVGEFMAIEASSRKSQKERGLEELTERLHSGDRLIATELSRIGRNMLETLNIIEDLHSKGIKIEFINQPELSTTAPHTKLLMAIYSYVAESEKDFISLRTKQGLNLAKARGKTLGRPKGSRNKHHPLDQYSDKITDYLKTGLSIAAIEKLINRELECKGTDKDNFPTYRQYQLFIQKIRK